MLYQLNDGNWITPECVRSIFANPASKEHDGPKAHVQIEFANGVRLVYFDSFEAALAQRDELAKVVNAAKSRISDY